MWSTKLVRRIALAVAAAWRWSASRPVATTAPAQKTAISDKKITIGYIPWDEAIAASYLWKNILEDQGYEVELKNVEVGRDLPGAGGGDVDLFLDSWLPQTHASYWARYGDKSKRSASGTTTPP